MTPRYGTTGLAITLAIGGAVALAQSPPAPPNADTRVTLAQYQQRGEQRLMAADTDGDGRVSRAEFVAAEAGHGDPASRFARLDTNGDGMIDRQEVDAMLAQRFHQLDTDGDGVLTSQERAATHWPGHHRGKDNVPSAPPG